MRKMIYKATLIMALIISGCSDSPKLVEQNTTIVENEEDKPIDSVEPTNPTQPIVEIKLSDLIEAYLNQNQINEDNIAIVVSDADQTYYVLNATQTYFAASTYKLPLAMLYYEYFDDL